MKLRRASELERWASKMNGDSMWRWKLFVVAVAFFPFLGGATEATSTPFQSVVIDGNSVVATLPARLKMQVTEGSGKRYRISQPGETFRLQSGATLVLTERHASYRISAQLVPRAGLVVDATADTRSTGGNLRTTHYFVPASAAPDSATCPLTNVGVAAGMSRTDVEKRVAASLGSASNYSTIANNLRGGALTYSAAGCVLEVEYAPGAPAPLVSRSPGMSEHLPAMDETVVKYKLRTELSSLLPKAEKSAIGTSTLTIEEAIDIAKRCVLERNIRLVGSFIESARFERNPRGDRGPYWLVTWAYSREIKGGQVFVSVFQSRMCEITYGE